MIFRVGSLYTEHLQQSTFVDIVLLATLASAKFS